MTTKTRPRPRSLPSTTTKLSTEFGSLFVTVSTDEDGEPFEVFGYLGKGGSFQHGVTELACRLISLHLRRGTPLEEVIDQIQGIQEMQPFFNQIDGRSVAVLGLGDGIAHILKAHLKAKEERNRRKRWNRRPHERPGQRSQCGASLRGGPASHLQDRRKEQAT